ncbi:MAG: ABC transporter permease [Ruminococcaceae bacterium]|jgi:simple sugar transport system permease protein|nr:ABC transporter permease [Oscillospiraceae bacterium]
MDKEQLKGEPLLRMSKRGEMLPAWKSWGIRLIAFFLSLVVSGIVIIAVSGLNPAAVFATMFEGAVGTGKRAWVTVRDAMTLLCIAVGLAPAFKMRFWNIGAEGQILVGGIAAAACMIYLKNLPAPLLLLVMILASLAAGGVWGFFPGLFKARWNTNETLFTLMMNYIAIQLTSYFVAMWENPFGSNSVGVINSQGKEGWLPNLFSAGYNKDYGWNVIIVLAVTVIMYLYMNHSKHGYEIAVIGDSENTARYAGIRVNRAYVRTIIFSGAICGLAGFVAVSGASHTISTATAGGRGFTAIIVAWLAQFNSVVMVIFSFLLVFLQKGAQAIASSYNLSQEVSEMITGIILFFLLGSEFFVNYTVHFRGKKVSA